jgi:hypothetical protein
VKDAAIGIVVRVKVGWGVRVAWLNNASAVASVGLSARTSGLTMRLTHEHPRELIRKTRVATITHDQGKRRRSPSDNRYLSIILHLPSR